MITKNEFLDALNITINYRIQLLEEARKLIAESMKYEDIILSVNMNPHKKVIDCDSLSVRNLNLLFNLKHIDKSFENKNVGDIELIDLAKLTKKQLLSLRQCGKKSIQEFESCLKEAGLKFRD